MAHGDIREGKWRGNWRMEWVASTLHTTSERGVASITTTDAHTSAASSRPNRRHHWFNPLNADLNPICHLLALLGAHLILHVSRIRVKWTRPFPRKTKFGFCACAITFQLTSTTTTSEWVVTRSLEPRNFAGNTALMLLLVRALCYA